MHMKRIGVGTRNSWRWHAWICRAGMKCICIYISNIYIHIEMYMCRFAEFFEIARLDVEGADKNLNAHIYNVYMHEMYVCI